MKTKQRTFSIWRAIFAVILLLGILLAVSNSHGYFQVFEVVMTSILLWLACAAWFAYEDAEDPARRERFLLTAAFFASFAFFVALPQKSWPEPERFTILELLRLPVAILFIRLSFLVLRDFSLLMPDYSRSYWRYLLFQPQIQPRLDEH